MGRKKKKPIKPWCWYCNREFDDDKILAQHQRAKHFKCPFCHKKLYSGPGLTVHCVQVHKEKLDKIPEALPNRNSVDIDIYGMQGVPEEDLREHERLKRGDEGPSKPQGKDNSQQETSKQDRHTQPIPNQHYNQNPLAANNPMAMHAAMFQHAMSMGAMPPPGFPMPPPGMPIPPPGSFMGPPPGYPGMLPPSLMHPGIPPPPPNFAFPPGMMPPSTMANVPPPPPPPMDFPPPPPPISEPSSSGVHVPPPPPMSGVGHLIGIPPPPIRTISARPPTPPQAGDIPSETTKAWSEEDKQQLSHRSHELANDTQQNGDVKASSSSTTMTKPAETSSRSIESKPFSQDNKAIESFIDVPSMKARIMHPNTDLSLEELRLKLSKYQNMLREKKQSDTVQEIA